MRILITTGIYPPEIGGPATYAAGLARRLAEAGHSVTVVTYANVPRASSDEALPYRLIRVVRKGRLVNRWHFYRAIQRVARNSDVVYALDWFAAGVPTAIAARLARVPYAVRVGGDYMWEQRYLESGAEPLPLTEFYERGLHRRREYRLFRWSIAFVLKQAARVVFNSEVQKQLYETYWGLSPERTQVIDNPIPKIEESGKRVRRTKELVYWGRFIAMKNLKTLIRAFAKAELPEGYTLTLIGDGPQKVALKSLTLRLGVQDRVHFERALPLAEVLERVRQCRAFILPSWTDISPNQVYEALAIGLPALVTKENYLRVREQLPETFDPHSVEELTEKLRLLANDRKYREFAKAFTRISFGHDWDDVLREHMTLFEQLLGRKDTDVRVLSIGADRSKQGILFAGTPAYKRQEAYARHFDAYDIIGFSRRSDHASKSVQGSLHVRPTDSTTPLLYGLDAYRLARRLPRPNIVSSQDPFETGVIAWCIARHFRVPLHVQVHTDVFAQAYAAHSIVNRARVVIAKFVLRRASRIRVVSQRIADSLMPLKLRAQVSVLPIYTDLARYSGTAHDPMLDAKFTNYARKLLCVGRLEPEKNFELALRSFATNAPADACLIMVGEGSQRAKLQALAEELGVIGRVYFEGAQDPAPYYALADLVLVPSRYEGYGLVVVEALAAGRPVIATDVGVAREAGAIVAGETEFGTTLKQWFADGPRSGALQLHQYATFDDYVERYCADLKIAS